MYYQVKLSLLTRLRDKCAKLLTSRAFVPYMPYVIYVPYVPYVPSLFMCLHFISAYANKTQTNQ